MKEKRNFDDAHRTPELTEQQISLLIEVWQVTVGGSPGVVMSQTRALCSGERGREGAEVDSGKGSNLLSLPRREVRDGWLVSTETHTEKHTPSHCLQGDRYLGLFHFLQSIVNIRLYLHTENLLGT